ncbi:MAG: hypothetical protein HZC37_09705 [Burkholderiales bacterium]|nr:hypothetical protein [Burkholderiales bacterium]
MSTITDDDIHAFAPADARPTAAAADHGARTRDNPRDNPRGRRWWPWVLLALAALFVAGVVGGVLVLGQTLDQALGGLDIRVDGEHVLTVPRGEAAWWAVAAGVLAGMVVLVVVPLSLLLVLLIAALVLAAALVVMLAVGALALSPLWVIALLIWLALREPRARQAGAPATPASAHAAAPAPREA